MNKVGIGVLIILVLLVVWVFVPGPKGDPSKQKQQQASSQQIPVQHTISVPKVYRKVTLRLQENWSEMVEHSVSQTIAVWGPEGMFFRTEKQGWVEKSYQDGISGLFGGAGANKLQFRGNPGDVVEYCIYPKGESWRVCQD